MAVSVSAAASPTPVRGQNGDWSRCSQGVSAAQYLPAGARRCACITPGHRAFWEATVLLRKLIIGLLAQLVSQPLVQSSAFTATMMLFLAAHQHWQPYREERFARAESASLLCLGLTAVLAINTQPAAGTAESAIVGINVVIVAGNVATLALLLHTWLRLCAPRQLALSNAAMRTVAQRVSLKRRRVSASTGKSPASARLASVVSAAPAHDSLSSSNRGLPSTVQSRGSAGCAMRLSVSSSVDSSFDESTSLDASVPTADKAAKH